MLALLPESTHPHIRRVYRWSRDLSAAITSGRRMVSAERIVWVRPEVADVERFRLLAPGPGQLLLRMGISLVSPGTERSFLLGLPNARTSFPTYPGYSGVGWVEAVGRGVTQLRVGERVAGWVPHASRALVEPARVVRVPEQISDEEAALVELGVIALQGVRRARVRPGDRVVVLGLGIVGQLTLRLARWAGSLPLVAAARTPAGFQAARAGGADECVELTTRSSVTALGGDIVLEATGSPQAIISAFEASRPGGRVVLLGSSRGVTEDVDLQRLISARGVEVVGAHISSLARHESTVGHWTHGDEADLFFDLVARRRLPVADLITRRASPSEANAVYQDLIGGRELGVLFDWRQPAISPATVSPSAPSVATTRASAGPVVIRPASPRLGIGFVGCGEIARLNAAGLRRSTGCRLVQVMDVDETAARSFGQRFEVAHTTRLEVMLENPDVEAVVIAVPHHLHALITSQAARAGKHVVVEKPMATTLQDADAMMAVCRQHRVALSVLFSFRYLPRVQRARELVQAGALGRIVGTRISFSIEKPLSYWAGGYSGSGTDWRGSKQRSGGGVLLMNVSHAIDFVRYVTGLEAERVYAEFTTANSPIEVEDIIAVTLRYTGGGIGSIDASSLARGEHRAEERIWGTHGSLWLAPDPARVYTLRKVAGLRPGQWQTLRRLPAADRLVTYFDRFATAIREGREPEVTAEDGRTNLAVMLAAYAAGDTGRPMKPGDAEA